jgi:hypothetical protein
MLGVRTRTLAGAVEARPFAVLSGVCAASFAVRAALVLLRGTYTEDYSSSDIGGIAYRIAAGQGFTYEGMPSSFFGPVFVYLWAFALERWGTTGQLLIQLLQAALLSVAPLCLWAFARLRFAAFPAFCGCVIFAFYPELLLLPTTMYADTLALFLWCANLALYAVAVRSRPGAARPAIALGICSGVLALTKGRLLLFSALLLLFLAAGDPSSLRGLFRVSRARVRSAVIALAATCVVLAPWVIRNQRVHGSFLLLESTSGLNLWMGHTEGATGTGKYRLGVGGAADPGEARSDDTAFPRSAELSTALRAATSELAKDRAFRDDAWRAVRADPAREVSLSLRKILYFWTIDPTSSVARSPGYWVPWAGLVVLLLVGLRSRAVQGRSDPLILAILVTATVLAVLYFVIPRLRYPVYPAVFLLAGQGAAALLARRAPSPAPPVEDRT